jgi:hypothetical protein
MANRHVVLANEVMSEYADKIESSKPTYDLDKDTLLADLLADLMHWAASTEVEFTECLTSAYTNYQYERRHPEEDV